MATMGTHRTGGTFVGLPASIDIVGPALCKWTAQLPCNRCSGPQGAWECPQRYYMNKMEPCHGFDERGAKVSAAWHNGDLTPATKAAWKSYILRHGLQQANSRSYLVTFS